jgi:acetyl-CoA acetyltransferase
LTIKGKAYIVGIYEHPTRHAPDKSTAQLHAEVAKGAIEDAGLSKDDVDSYFLSGDAPGCAWPMVDYLGLKVRQSTAPIQAAPPTLSSSAMRPKRLPRASARSP